MRQLSKCWTRKNTCFNCRLSGTVAAVHCSGLTSWSVESVSNRWVATRNKLFRQNNYKPITNWIWICKHSEIVIASNISLLEYRWAMIQMELGHESKVNYCRIQNFQNFHSSTLTRTDIIWFNASFYFQVRPFSKSKPICSVCHLMSEDCQRPSH